MLHLRGRRGGAYVTGEVIMATVTIQEAAQHLGVSQDTVRRRIRKEELQARQTPTPQGFRWVVTIPDTPPNNTPPPGEDTDNANGGALVVELKARVNNLEEQLTIRAGEISELHPLLAQNALNAAPGRPWWQFWR